jgi:hypothetical protein
MGAVWLRGFSSATMVQGLGCNNARGSLDMGRGNVEMCGIDAGLFWNGARWRLRKSPRPSGAAGGVAIGCNYARVSLGMGRVRA